MAIDKPKNAIAQKIASSETSAPKKRNIALYIIGIILMAFNGLALFAGLVVMLSGEFGNNDVALLIFLLVFFLLGLFFVLRNKRPKGEAQDIKNSYEVYKPYLGQKVGWRSVALGLFFCFPVGYYLLYKKMSQYSTPEEMVRNSKTLRTWAIVLMCLGCVYPVMRMAGQLKAYVAIICFISLFPFGLFLFKKARLYQKTYTTIPASQRETSVDANSAAYSGTTSIPSDTAQPESHASRDYAEFYYQAKEVAPTYVVVNCKGCNAPNRIVKGQVAECEYCGAPVSDSEVAEEPIMDNDEAAVSQAFAVIQRLLESMDEVSDDLHDAFDRLSHAMDIFPNRSMPLNVEMDRTGSCLNRFGTEAKRISVGIREQVMIACDNLMAYNDESWEKVETEIEKLGDIKTTMAETISSMRSFSHSIDGLNINAGFQTRRIKSAQLRLTKEVDRSLTIMQSAMSDYTASLKTFHDAKFTSKTNRINAQKNGRR